MTLQEGQVVAFWEGKRKWIAKIDEIYGDLCTIVWRCSGCSTDDVPLSKLQPEDSKKWK